MITAQTQKSQRIRTAKKIFSPSDSDRFALIIHNETDQYQVIKDSDIQLEHDGEVELSNGDYATLVMIGSHSECRSRLNSLKKKSKDKTGLDDLDDESNEQENMDFSFDEPSVSTFSFIRRPQKGYRTPAARRRNNLTKGHVGSPYTSRKTAMSTNQNFINRETISEVGPYSSQGSMRETNHVIQPTTIFSDDCVATNNNFASTDLSGDHSSLMHSLRHEMLKLSRKISRLSNAHSFRNQDLSSYRDQDDNEIYPSEIKHNGENLLSISARDPADYARKVLRRLFTNEELAMYILPSRFDHLYTKKPLDAHRFDILNNAIRVNYRISRNNYCNFYAKIIQKTLSDCIYNEGTRKKVKQAAICQQKTHQNTLSSNTSQMNTDS